MKKFNYLLLIIVSIFFSITNVFALSNIYDKEERTEINNYGVNKSNIEISSDNKNNILRTPYVDETIKVYDYANVLSDSEEEILRNKINEFYEKTGMDFVVLYVDFSSYSSDSYIEGFAADFYDYNDFGINSSSYSGVIFIRDVVGRRDDIVLTGEAMQYYDDDRLDDINEYIDSDIRYDYYSNTITDLINRMNYWYNLGKSSSSKYIEFDEKGNIHYLFRPPYVLCFIASILVSVFVTVFFVKKNKMVHKAKDANDYLDKTSIFYRVKNDVLIGSHTSHYTVNSGGSSGGGFHGSSGISHSSGGVHHR